MSGPRVVRLHWHDPDSDWVRPRWLVKNMLPESGVALLAGQWSAGKTFVALDLAECVGTGRVFADRKIKRTGGTLFLAAEAAGDIPLRLKGLTAAPLSPKRERLPFTWTPDVPSISKPHALEQLVAIAKQAEAKCNRSSACRWP